MKKIIALSLFFSLFVITFSGCKPTAKNEVKYWENNKKEFAEAVALYPSFKGVLSAKMEEAKKIWSEAEKISNEENKAKKMKEANEKIDEVLNQFTQIKYKIQGIERSIGDLNGKKLKPSVHRKRLEITGKAKAVIQEAGNKLRNATFTGEEEALKVTKDVIGSLITAQQNIDSFIKSIKK